MKLFHLKFPIMLIFMNVFEKIITMEKLYLNQENVNLDKWKFMIYLIIHGLIGKNSNQHVVELLGNGSGEPKV
ncbi:hypothetical protein SAMN02745152_02126 [Treponema berlinense]|uniref:Uncharacterized protein n=1 Tax=Treponema berlinense TaxID=225004 RepID=A0A1T4QUY2_9SPIR|nr:hypothetical protein SAMN02745152_02126 [Treponema berlinense]